MAFKDSLSKLISTIEIRSLDASEASEWENLTKRLEKGCNNVGDFEKLTYKFTDLCVSTQLYLSALEPVLKATKVKTESDIQQGIADPETDLTLKIMQYRARAISNLTKAYSLMAEECKKFDTIQEQLPAAAMLASACSSLIPLQTIEQLNDMLADPEVKDLSALNDPYNAALLEQFQVKVKKLAEKDNKGMAKFETFVAEKEAEKGTQPEIS